MRPGTVKVGAVALAASGRVYDGSYLGASSGFLARHAEDVALTHAALNDENCVVAIAVVSERSTCSSDFTYPCGVCRQRIVDAIASPATDIRVLCGNMLGGYIVESARSLLPFSEQIP